MNAISVSKHAACERFMVLPRVPGDGRPLEIVLRSVGVEQLLRVLRFRCFSRASDRRMRAFCGFSSSDAMKPSSSSLSSTFRPTCPVATRELRTTTTPFFTAFAAAVTDALFMLPFPTPGDDDALGALWRRRSRSSPATCRAEAKMMSTRGSAVTCEMSNSLCVVCFHAGVVVKVVLAVAGDADEAANGRHERLHRGRAGLGQRVRAVDPVVHHDQHAASFGLGSAATPTAL